MNMELDYSGAKSLEEARAIHKAFWDNINHDIIDGKIRFVPLEEFQIMVAERRRKHAEELLRQQNEQNGDITNNPT